MKKVILLLVLVTSVIFFEINSVKAYIVNAGFETGDLSGWTSGGQAGVQDIIVYSGNYAAWIGTVDFDGDNVNDITGAFGTEGYTNNWISQVIDVTNMDKLQFWYNFYTWDFVTWDEPGFEIDINGTPVLSIDAKDIDTSGDDSTLDFTGWTLFTYDLSNYSGSTLELTIYAGNTGDAIIQSWAYIDNTEPVPEPCTIFLVGTGLLGVIFLSQRKKR